METRELTDMTAVLRSINDGNPSNAERWVNLTQRVIRAETRANAAERAAARWKVIALTMAAALVLTLSFAAHQANEVARLQLEAQGMSQTEIVTPQNQNTAVQP